MIKQLMVVPDVSADPNQVTQQVALYNAEGEPLALAGGFEVTETYEISVESGTTTAVHGAADLGEFEDDTAGWYDSEEGLLALPAGTYQFSVIDFEGGGAFNSQWLVAFQTTNALDGTQYQTFPLAYVNETARTSGSRIVHFPVDTDVLGISWNRVVNDSSSTSFTARIQKL